VSVSLGLELLKKHFDFDFGFDLVACWLICVCVFQSLNCISECHVMVNGNVSRDQLPATSVATAAGSEAASSQYSVLDDVLYNLENGVEIALHRAQVWSKFAKDLITFIDKRTNICK